MDQVITMIGNAVVDPFFRSRLLENPEDAMDNYQFRLTKGDYELMMAAFAGLSTDDRKELEEIFLALENKLYQRLDASTRIPIRIPPCTHPCLWSAYPPKELRDKAKGLAESQLHAETTAA